MTGFMRAGLVAIAFALVTRSFPGSAENVAERIDSGPDIQTNVEDVGPLKAAQCNSIAVPYILPSQNGYCVPNINNCTAALGMALIQGTQKCEGQQICCSKLNNVTLPTAPNITNPINATFPNITVPNYEFPHVPNISLPITPNITTQTATTEAESNAPSGNEEPNSEFEQARATEAPSVPSLPTPAVPTPPQLPPLPTVPALPAPPSYPEPPALPPTPSFPATPALPPAPTLPQPPALPPTPSIPQPPALPPAPTLPQPPALPPAPTLPQPPALPPTPSFPETPAIPPAPTFPQPPALPPTPSFPDTPAVPQPPALPPTPSFPETPALPPAPTFPQPPALPPTPSIPQPPALPPTPTLPALPTTPNISSVVPALPSIPPTPEISNVIPALPSIPQTPNISNTVPALPQIPPTPDISNVVPALPTLPAAPNITGTVPSIPNPPSVPSIPQAPAVPPVSASPPTPADPPQSASNEDSPPAPTYEVKECKNVTGAVESTFTNPQYPATTTDPLICQHIVVPADGYCGLRLDVLEAGLAARNGESCSIDSLQIINSLDTPAVPQCGLISGYQFTVRTAPAQPVTILVTSQSPQNLWKVKATQIPCANIKKISELQSKDCGKKGAHEAPDIGLPVIEERVKVIPGSDLLKPDKKRSEPFPGSKKEPKVPEELLRKAILSFEQELKIVRGNETGVNEWPWQALLLVNGRPLCGASLISDQYVLTAGHCVSVTLRIPLSSLLVVNLGDHDLRTTKEAANKVYRVGRIVPNVQHDLVNYDIALIKLKTKVEFSEAISPVCLPERPESGGFEGESVISTGWGKTESSVISPVLRQAELEVIPNRECKSAWDLLGEGGGDLIQDGMICAGGGDAGPCNGDSGGPLVIKDPNFPNKWRLIGLTSFGSLRGCALPGVPSVYTRVSTYLEWIALNLAEP